MVFSRRRVSAKRTAAAREKSQAGALAENSPQCRQSQNRRLKGSVRIDEKRPDRCRSRIAFEGGHERVHRPGLHHSVGVQQQNKRSACLARTTIAGGTV